MNTLDGLPPLRDVIREHGLSAKKSLGQNFILDLNLTGKIARLAGPLEEALIIEVGPGPGGLTRALLSEGARHVIAIERDERVRPVLEEIASAYPESLTIIEDDALKVDYPRLIAAQTDDYQHVRIVSNLPYSIGTQLLVNWLSAPHWPPWFDRLVLMFQREVADRIVATPGSKSYGRLAVLAQWRADVGIGFNLPARAFTPPPKVDSAVIVLSPHAAPANAPDPDTIGDLTAAAFGQRRKMLRASLKQFASKHDLDLSEWLASANIDETARAETLSVQDYVSLARAVRPHA